VFFNHIVTDTGFAVETVDIRKGIEFYDIFIARFVFGEQYKVFRLRAGTLIQVIVGGVQFATDNVFYPLFNTLFGKVQGRVHIAVIGNRASVDIVFDEMID
jgi:hypothetical protein